jgi:hypothetical protein
MPAGRATGQDTTIFIVVAGDPVDEITAIASFDITWKFSIKSEEYVGETHPRKDDFYEGLSGRIEYHGESAAALTLIQAIQARAQNRGLATKIGCKSTIQFPDGERAMINVPNMFFSDIPMNVPSRTDYVKFTLSWEAEDGKIVSR